MPSTSSLGTAFFPASRMRRSGHICRNSTPGIGPTRLLRSSNSRSRRTRTGSIRYTDHHPDARRRMRIAEVPIPTYYGDEICYVDGMGYAADVTKDVITYRLQKAGFGDGSRIALSEEYQLKPSDDSSHGRISKLLQCRPPSRILDLGCSSGLLSERLRRMGHYVVGVDVNEIDGVRDRTDEFLQADLNEGIPAAIGGGLTSSWRRTSSSTSSTQESHQPSEGHPGSHRDRSFLRTEHRTLVSEIPVHPGNVRL